MELSAVVKGVNENILEVKAGNNEGFESEEMHH